MDLSTSDGCGGGRQRIPFYVQRNRNLDWRSSWFSLSRSKDQPKLLKYRDIAYNQKLALIKKRGKGSGRLAGYDPAGAGSPWFSVGPRNVNGRVKSLAIHPTNPQILYAGTAAGGVWKSSDGGQTWDPLWDTQETMAIGAIAVSVSSPNTIYAGTGEWTPGWSGNYGGAGVYVSEDAGVTWSKRPAVNSRYIGQLVVDPTNVQRLWVCGDRGLERSTDGGVTWTTLRNSTVTDIVLDPLTADTMFIAVRYDGFYKSTDGGDTFNLLPGAPAGATVDFPKMAIGKSGTHTNKFIVVKMGTVVQSSIDGGTTFSVVPGTHGTFYPGWCDEVAVAPDNENILFWGGASLDRTSDGGANWRSLPVHADQHVVAFAPSNSNIVYFANDGGVWRSADKGETVEKASNGLVITQFYNINFWKSLSNVIGGGAQDNGVNLTTSSLSWSPIYGGDGGWILIDPADPRIIYTESQNGDIVKSTDGGKSWVGKTDGIVGPRTWEGVLQMDPNDHLRIFYGTDRVLRSTDGIATPWTESSQILFGQVTAIWVAASNSNRIYTGTTSGSVYRSDDGGNTTAWADKSGSLPRRPVTSISTTTDENNVLVSFGGLSGADSSQSIYRTTDGGDTWVDASGDLPRVVANSVVSDPSDANTWYLATDVGVFRTTNLGASWLAFDNGIPSVPCTGLVVDVTSKILYCGTFGRGAYKLDINPGVVKQAVDIYLRDNDLDTGERLPSPYGLPDPLVPAPGSANFWTSPDIKLNHEPFFTRAGVFDGVDFDTALVHQDPYRGRTNRFYIQVQNRGWQSTQNVSVRAFLADASVGLPDLPNALTAPNFDLTSTASWTPIGAAKSVADLKPNRPVILTWDFNISVTGATHSCCLVVISCPDDPFTNTSTNIAQLVKNDKRTCLKNLHVVDPGPGGMPFSKLAIDFHNRLARKAKLDILIKPIGFAAGRVGLLLPKIKFTDSEKAEDGGVAFLPLCSDDPLGKWYLKSPLPTKRKPKPDPEPSDEADKDETNKSASKLLETRFLSTDRTRIFDFDPTTSSTLRGIEVGPHQTLKAVLVARLKNDVYLTGPSRLEIVQFLDGELVGGSTFQFGYELPRPGTTGGPCRRIRITADELVWEEKRRRRHRDTCKRQGDDCDCPQRRGGGDEMLVAKVVVGDDPARTSYRFIRRGGDNADEVRDAAASTEQRRGGLLALQQQIEHAAAAPADKSGPSKPDKPPHKQPKQLPSPPPPQILLDTTLTEGESLTLSLSILNHDHHDPGGSSTEPTDQSLLLYTRRFPPGDGIRAWIGEYDDEGLDGSGLGRVRFTVSEVRR
jgi:photosystem II stability/assembly factor-like uncharacterized protein